MLPKDKLLAGSDNPEELARILDKAESALRKWEVTLCDFYGPPVIYEATEIFSRLTEISLISGGGYPQAERQRIALARAEIPLSEELVDLTLLSVAGNFLFDPATHRDFLGAVLGTGIVRHKVGDIVVLGERGAQILVVPEIADFLQTALNQVRSVPVKTTPIPLSDLKIRPPKTKEMTTVEASLRLDAIASAGFGMSRSKMADAIGAGDVRVNWKEITQASHGLQTGDLVTYRGKGRLAIGDINVTKKSRYRIELTRYQ
ncbi:MAG: photosystem II S4 domain protein [Cyanobacteria bacterium P01_H01_bin.15]